MIPVKINGQRRVFCLRSNLMRETATRRISPDNVAAVNTGSAQSSGLLLMIQVTEFLSFSLLDSLQGTLAKGCSIFKMKLLKSTSWRADHPPSNLKSPRGFLAISLLTECLAFITKFADSGRREQFLIVRYRPIGTIGAKMPGLITLCFSIGACQVPPDPQGPAPSPEQSCRYAPPQRFHSSRQDAR